MTVRHFCTLFDRNYLFKGVTMLRSLVQHSPGACIRVLCLDEVTALILERLEIPGVSTLKPADVETADVLAIKPGRSVAEYCWTLSSVLTWHLMQGNPDIDLITYVDADLMFFSDVEPIFAEMGAASILAIEHRYTPQLQRLLPYGRFNVQWVTFRRNAPGMQCLRQWRDDCVKWCFARIEPGRHGDQKYLDEWPATYGKAFHSLSHVGAGVAPWNYPNYRFSERDGRLFVDDVPLVFFHFHQFQLLERGGFSHFSTNYGADVAPPELVYDRYRQALGDTTASVRRVDPQFSAGIRNASTTLLRRVASRWLPLPVKSALKRMGLRTW